MTPKPGQGASSEAKKGAAEPSSYASEAGQSGKPAAAGTSDLDSKQRALAALQAQEKALVAEIGRLRALEADIAAFESQVNANSDALDKQRKDLQTFTTNELKALDPKTRAAIAAVVQEADTAIGKAGTEADEAAKESKASAETLEKSLGEAARAEAAYTKAKQGVAEAKRAIGQLNALKKEIQAAEGRNEFLVAGYWLLELERRLPETELPETADVTSASEELGAKRQALEDARNNADSAKVTEMARRKARDEAEKNRQTRILERLKSQAEAQKPETAA